LAILATKKGTKQKKTAFFPQCQHCILTSEESKRITKQTLYIYLSKSNNIPSIILQQTNKQKQTMKLSIPVSFTGGVWLVVVVLAASYTVTTTVVDAYTPSVPRVTPIKQSNVLDSNADVAMSQYEAALKAAFANANANAATPASPVASTNKDTIAVTPPVVTAPAPKEEEEEATTNNYFSVSPHMMKNTHAFVDNNVAAATATPSAFVSNTQQEKKPVLDQYEAALKAAFEATAPPTIIFDANNVQDEALPIVSADDEQQQQQPNWDSISEDINAKIENAELKQGGRPLSAAAKGDIVGTVLAGSAVLGTAAIHSPLLMGAALGYASTHVLGGKRGEALSKASEDALQSAIEFSKSQLELEHGDISKASKRILNHIQHVSNDKFDELSNEISNQAQHARNELTNAPTLIAEKTKQYVSSDEFKSMPSRSFKAFTTFLNSDEVQNAKKSAVKAIKDGLESDELKAVKNRATLSLNDISSSEEMK
jgi:gas vesicle protein